MIEIKSTDDIIKTKMQVTVLLIVGSVVATLIKPSSVIITIILLLYLVLFCLLEKFTVAIRVDDAFIVVTYYKLFQRKEKFFPIQKVELEIAKQIKFRSLTPLYILTIVDREEKKWQIDSQDGFTEYDFAQVVRYFNKMRLEQV
ncbi:hypothetical protein SAMN05444266_10583 [Chitinophaga jiangningensis]|uniref:PH domain-containing protein n=1 Tax=Chitinophaga jiangningensis TaxID=1419482 RepID=A0A1M7DPZ4_9BACT|nr:hypothetical protein [Chitinophaga jiangningensis]SHL81478.1 hypothetical protein SAMN05444266_10583 [Chitinophaga jiangningensis]